MKQLSFTAEGWPNYLYWQQQDKKTLNKINKLIADIERNGHEGLGKPEPLKHRLSGWHSRHLDEANRLVYRITDSGIEISQCRDHYDET
jgi:toxin YoeB